MGESTHESPLPPAALAVGLVVAAALAAWTLVEIWWLARPVEPGTVCTLQYPGPPGCAPGLRFTAAFVSAVVVSLAYAAVTAVLLTVARRRVLAGVWALGGLAILGALAVQLVRWGGLAG